MSLAAYSCDARRDDLSLDLTLPASVEGTKGPVNCLLVVWAENTRNIDDIETRHSLSPRELASIVDKSLILSRFWTLFERFVEGSGHVRKLTSDVTILFPGSTYLGVL